MKSRIASLVFARLGHIALPFTMRLVSRCVLSIGRWARCDVLRGHNKEGVGQGEPKAPNIEYTHLLKLATTNWQAGKSLVSPNYPPWLFIHAQSKVRHL
jgi:hypothetical protein